MASVEPETPKEWSSRRRGSRSETPRRTRRGGGMGRECPPSRLEGLGNVISSPSGVRGRALAKTSLLLSKRVTLLTRSSAIAEGPRDASCQL